MESRDGRVWTGFSELISGLDGLDALIFAQDNLPKLVSSTDGMKLSKETSELLKHRISEVLPKRLENIELGIKEFDFEKVAEITMRDSNQFHAICLDTYPPLFYLNDISKIIIAAVNRYKEFYQQIKIAYTFDAGANAVLIIRDENTMNEFAVVLQSIFNIEPLNFVIPEDSNVSINVNDLITASNIYINSSLSIISTKIGQGTSVIDSLTD